MGGGGNQNFCFPFQKCLTFGKNLNFVQISRFFSLFPSVFPELSFLLILFRFFKYFSILSSNFSLSFPPIFYFPHYVFENQKHVAHVYRKIYKKIGYQTEHDLSKCAPISKLLYNIIRTMINTLPKIKEFNLIAHYTY